MTADAQEKATGLLDEIRDRSRLEKLNDVFDKRVAGALERLKMPTKKDIDSINRKLNKILKLLEEKPAAPKPKTVSRKKPAARKTAVRKTSRKKAA